MVWILECSCPNRYENNMSVWQTEVDACKQACDEILENIQNQTALDEELVVVAKAINDHIVAHEYKKAVVYWNNCSYNVNKFEDVYWHISDHPTLTYTSTVATLDPSKFPLNVANQSSTSNQIVNDHTCTICGNTACSTQEAKCWRCGNPIS